MWRFGAGKPVWYIIRVKVYHKRLVGILSSDAVAEPFQYLDTSYWGRETTIQSFFDELDEICD